MLALLETACVAHVTPGISDLRLPVGARTLTIEAATLAEWIELALQSSIPVNQRRLALKALVQRELLLRTDRDDVWQRSPELRAAIGKAWPTQQAIRVVDRLLSGPSGKRRAWTVADQFLVDEANSLLDGTPFTFGLVIVDEAQDHSAVALRVLGRRSPSRSMTILGDLAQSTTPAGQQDWDVALAHLGATDSHVAHLTIGYRVPAPILDVANRLLPFTDVVSQASRSVRLDGVAPSVDVVAPNDLADAVARRVVAVRHRHHNTGVVGNAALHEAIAAALARRDLAATSNVHALAANEVPLFTPEAVKGLEFDGVIVVNPHEIFDGSARGARLLYVAMTRAVQVLAFVTDAPLPALIG